ncbi:MAG: UvrB/UvrC motif-containing protein, partial [Proteobacteria bacterium]|nr:UvrB/UvrC motif-containing protein [Pseudomonadota bacterium]
YQQVGIKTKYLHSEVHTLDRVELISGLRRGDFDLLVGINLLREGLDLPEVSLVGIMDADKEGFLRSRTSLIQTIGRAARNVDGVVILYADNITRSMNEAMGETERRRVIQDDYNKAHGITPQNVKRVEEALLYEKQEITEQLKDIIGDISDSKQLPKDLKSTQKLLRELKDEMYKLAKSLEFEKAALMRDRIKLLEQYLLSL